MKRKYNKRPDNFYYYLKKSSYKRKFNSRKFSTKLKRRKSYSSYSRKLGYGRKISKLTLMSFLNKRYVYTLIALVLMTTIVIGVISFTDIYTTPVEVTTEPSTQSTTIENNSHQIQGVPVLYQDEYQACCESYSCTMLLQYLGFDIEIGEFIDNYLVAQPLEYDEYGNIYGPDLDSAFAGDLQHGYGVYSPAMAKFMNNYLSDQNSNLKATAIKDSSLDDICQNYIKNDIPVMIWATENFAEPYVKDIWIVNYTDENSTKEIGDTMEWLMYQHCMVLMGYDKDYYYMCDPIQGTVTNCEKEIFDDLYEKLGSQIVVVQ